MSTPTRVEVELCWGCGWAVTIVDFTSSIHAILNIKDTSLKAVNQVRNETGTPPPPMNWLQLKNDINDLMQPKKCNDSFGKTPGNLVF